MRDDPRATLIVVGFFFRNGEICGAWLSLGVKEPCMEPHGIARSGLPDHHDAAVREPCGRRTALVAPAVCVDLELVAPRDLDLSADGRCRGGESPAEDLAVAGPGVPSPCGEKAAVGQRGYRCHRQSGRAETGDRRLAHAKGRTEEATIGIEQPPEYDSGLEVDRKLRPDDHETAAADFRGRRAEAGPPWRSESSEKRRAGFCWMRQHRGTMRRDSRENNSEGQRRCEA
jgi:hypothetical protein